MKRWLLCLASLAIFADSASAGKLMVVFDQAASASAGRDTTLSIVYQQNLSWVSTFLTRLGITYKVIPESQVKTEFMRTGVQVWNYGTSGAYTEAFNGVLGVGFHGKQAGKFGPTISGNIYSLPDSITLSATGGPTVPQLYWITATTSNNLSAVADTAIDSTGSTGSAVAGASGDTPNQRYAVPADNPTKPFLTTVIPMSGGRGSPAGGIRKILSNARFSANNAVGTASDLMAGPTNTGPGIQTCAWCDSGSGAVTGAGDSMVIWDRPFSHITGAKSIIFAFIQSANNFNDSNFVLALFRSRLGGLDLGVALASLAHLDSLAGGTILPKSQIRVACVMRGGFRRGSPWPRAGQNWDDLPATQGSDLGDSASIKASIDSLATLRPPFKLTLETSIDSVVSYPYEKTWWAKLPMLKYSPVTYAGISDSTKVGSGSGTNLFMRPVDVFGRYRSRIAYGDNSATGKDSSLGAGVRSLFFHGDSIFGSVNVSHFLLPPRDDWTPSNTGQPGFSIMSASFADSSLYAMKLNGASGLLINAQKIPVSFSNPVGFGSGGERTYSSALIPSGFKLLGHSGLAVSGSRILVDVRSDSSDYAGGIAMCTSFCNEGLPIGDFVPGYERARLWWQVLMPSGSRDFQLVPDRWGPWSPSLDFWEGLNTPADDRIYGYGHGSVFLCSVNGLAGGYDTSPRRPLWWTIKSLSNEFDFINRLAGRTIIGWDYPDAITP